MSTNLIALGDTESGTAITETSNGFALITQVVDHVGGENLVDVVTIPVHVLTEFVDQLREAGR